MSATERLMRTRPLDELTIAEITDAADIGHGTFYLHFKSKYEVVVPIIHQYTQRWDKAIQKKLVDIEDPAEAVAYSGRQMARQILADPLWQWFLKESGVPVEDVQGALADLVTRDVDKGLETGRFELPDPQLATGFLFGGIVNGLLTGFATEDPYAASDQLLELILRVLGVPVEEARAICHRPLPEL